MEPTYGITCPACGALNNQGSRFCLSCGAALEAPTDPYAQPQYQQQYQPQYQQQYQQQYYPQYQQPQMVIPAGALTCPRCGGMAKRGGYQAWQIIIAICFFPIGMLALLADKSPTVCPNCGYSWQA
jgi:hypothetical protein